jgi:hypothetical protein
MTYIILILSLKGRVIERHVVPTLQACIEMVRETNDDGSKQAACMIRTVMEKAR